MKQIIKSCSVYNAEFPKDVDLEAALEESKFVDLLATQQLSIGFVKRDEFGTYVEKFAGGTCFTLRVDQKLVSAALVNSQLKERMKDIEALTGRKVGKKERRELRLETLEALLAITPGQTTNIITCFHHTESNMLLVPSTSQRLCDRITSALVHAIDSLKTQTIHVSNVKSGLTNRLRDWLDGKDSFADLYPVNFVGLDLSNLRVSMKLSDLINASGGLKEALSQGFSVKSLGLKMLSGTDVRLSDDFKLSALSFAHPPVEGDDDLFLAEATLEVDEIVSFVNQLCEMFGYEEPAEA